MRGENERLFFLETVWWFIEPAPVRTPRRERTPVPVLILTSPLDRTAADPRADPPAARALRPPAPARARCIRADVVCNIVMFDPGNRMREDKGAQLGSIVRK